MTKTQKDLDLACSMLEGGWHTEAEEIICSMHMNDVLDDFEAACDGNYDDVDEDTLDLMNCLHDAVIEIQTKWEAKPYNMQ